MASNNKLLSLNQRIERNLTEVYENTIVPLKRIIEFVEQYNEFKLSGADALAELFSNNKKDSGQPGEVISTHGLPGFFAGDRDAKTVMLMLNPGQDVSLANNPITTYDRIKRSGINIDSLDDFISTFKKSSENYGEIDKDRADNFDLKQAAFLKHWDGWSDKDKTHFAGFLDSDYKKMLKGKIDDETKEKINDINKKAKQIVLMQKLSMDLVPYASRKFEGISPKKMELLFPYLETLFHEIFEKDRKYVIFCSAFYNNLFKQYNKYSKRENRKWEIKELVDKPIPSDDVFENKSAYCTPIIIRNKDNGEQRNAIIAHTFPNQSLPNAYEKMEKYGKFCFEEWKKAFGTDK